MKNEKKTLKQIKEENRKLIIMACNPKAKSYEEALMKEFIDETSNSDVYPCYIGKPLTLNRVLLALSKRGGEVGRFIF
jgi:ribosomal protein L30E